MQIVYRRKVVSGVTSWRAVYRSDAGVNVELTRAPTKELAQRAVYARQLNLRIFAAQNEWSGDYWREYCEALARGGNDEAQALAYEVRAHGDARRNARRVEIGLYDLDD